MSVCGERFAQSQGGVSLGTFVEPHSSAASYRSKIITQDEKYALVI